MTIASTTQQICFLVLSATLVLGSLAVVLLPTQLKNHGIYLFTYWLIYVIATMGLNLTVGYAGQKSLGHAAFFGIGAYTMAIFLKAGISFWLGLPVAALLCFVVGLILGFPALRVQTIYLAFATLGFNTALWLVMRNEEWLTGGTFGINNIARPMLGGLSLDRNLPYYYLVLSFTLVLGALPPVRATLGPLVTAIAVIPPIALLPILFIALGLGETAKVALIAIGVALNIVREGVHLVARSADGLMDRAIDAEGRVYVTTLAGIQVFSEAGQRLGTIPLPVQAQSVACISAVESRPPL